MGRDENQTGFLMDRQNDESDIPVCRVVGNFTTKYQRYNDAITSCLPKLIDKLKLLHLIKYLYLQHDY